MNAQTQPSDFRIIRRTSERPDPKHEQIIELDPDHPAIRLLRLVLPLGGVRYLAPKGPLATFLAFDGTPIVMKFASTEEEITLHPQLRVVGLAEDRDPVVSATTLCTVLHPHYDEQVAHLRQRINSIFSAFIGLDRTEERLDRITDHRSEGARPLRERIRDNLGLEVEWVLESDPVLQQWIRKLQAALSSSETQTFNGTSNVNQFKLTYTCRILSVIPSKRHIALRRAKDGRDATAEISNIRNLVHAVLDPALGIFTGNIKVWLYPNFWTLLRLAFQEKVCPRVAAEFGYNVYFDDFKRELTAAKEATLKLLENQGRAERQFLDAETFYLEVKEEQRKALRETGFNYEAPSVQRFDTALKRAEAELNEAREKMETASRGVAPQLGVGDSAQVVLALTQFHNLFQLDRPDLLRLEDQAPPPPSS